MICVFSLPVFETPKTVFLALGFLCFLIVHYKAEDLKKVLLMPDVRAGFLALTLAAVLSALFAKNPAKAVHGAVDFFRMYMLYAMVASDFSDEKSIKNIARALILSAALGAIWGMVKYSIIKGEPVELNSVGHFNHSSIYLAMALIAAIAHIRRSETRAETYGFALPSALLLLAALGLTTSRATYAAFFAAVAVIAAFNRGFRKIAMAAAVIFIIVLIPLFVFTVGREAHFALATKGFSMKSLYSRADLWKFGLEIYKAHPIVGVGSKNFQYENPADYGVSIPDKNPSHPHNLYVNTLAQNGTIGFAALLFLFYLSFKAVIKNKDHPMQPAALGALVIVLTNGMLNTTLHSEHGMLFALMMSLAAAGEKQSGGRQ